MRAQLLELARRASTPGWWTAHSDVLSGWFEAYLGLEGAASVICTFELQFVQACSKPRTTPARSPCSATRARPPGRSTARSACA